MKPQCPAALPHAGFSLVEVMVALVVVSVGLLGVAKMQALALASTGTAKMRALASIEAASLASTLRADRAYWSSIGTNMTVNVSSAAAVSASTGYGALATVPTSGCTTVTPVCTSVQIAAQDLSDWAQALITALPGGSAVITCNPATGTDPVTCSIKLTWNENLVALSTATNAAATVAQNQNALANIQQTQYALYVQP